MKSTALICSSVLIWILICLGISAAESSQSENKPDVRLSDVVKKNKPAKKFRVKVNVESEIESLADVITMYLNKGLRELGDIQTVDKDDEDYVYIINCLAKAISLDGDMGVAYAFLIDLILQSQHCRHQI